MSASRHNGGVRLPEPLGDPITTIDFPVPEERLTGYYLHLIQDPSATRESLVTAGNDPREVDLARVVAGSHEGLARRRRVLDEVEVVAGEAFLGDGEVDRGDRVTQGFGESHPTIMAASRHGR